MDGDAAKSPDVQNMYRPDQVIRPQTGEASTAVPQDTPKPQPETAPAVASADASTTPKPEVPPAASVDADAQAAQTLQPELPQAGSSSEYQTMSASDGDMPESISWTASEFIAHEKTVGWYVLSVLGAVVAAALVWLITRDVTPTSAVFIGMLLLAYYASHKPRQQHYTLDDSGLTIGNRHLPYHEFRSFAFTQEGAFLCIELTPLKRFAMYTTIYIDPADEDRIIGFLSAYLPLEEARTSMTDSLMRRIHF